MSNTIEYSGKVYAEKQAAGVKVYPDNVFVLEHLNSATLVKIHNTVREATSLKGTKRFATQAKGVVRTWAALQAWDELMKAEEVEAGEDTVPAPKTERKLRGMRFIFKPMQETVSPKANTLRAAALELLKGGATFGQVENLVKKFDEKRGKEPFNLVPRTYELIRIVHYYLGYGLKQDDKGDITAYTD